MKTLCECGCGAEIPNTTYKGRRRRYVHGHNGRSPLSPGQRLLAKVIVRGDCWEWTGAVSRNGYGTIGIDGRGARVHRVAYELWVGPIPDGLHIDHLCRNRRCVNPDHLEAVTQEENNRRAGAVQRVKTKCRRGHEYTPENTYYNNRGYRGCRTCGRMTTAAARKRRAA